jgi:hypothetical protein
LQAKQIFHYFLHSTQHRVNDAAHLAAAFCAV